MIRICCSLKKEIKDLLEDEIISRYFYEDGAIAYTIRKDVQVTKALEILNNKEKYTSILNGTSEKTLVTKNNGPKNLKRNVLGNKGI